MTDAERHRRPARPGAIEPTYSAARFAVVAAGIAVWVAAAGCRQSVVVGEIPQNVKRIPARVQRILVAPFASNLPEWGPLAGDILATALQDSAYLLREDSVIGPSDVTEPEDEQLRPGGRRLAVEEEALVRARLEEADAVIFGAVAIDRINADGAKPGSPPTRITVRWTATMMDVATRQIFARMTLELSRPPAGSGFGGRPNPRGLDRRPRREPDDTPPVQADKMIREISERFAAAMEETPESERHELPELEYIYGKEADWYARRGRMELVENIHRRATLLRPDDPVLYYNIGLFAERQGRLDDAMRFYEYAMRLAPDDDRFRDARDRIFLRVRGGPLLRSES